VHRLQVPATPDPYDDATSDTDRQAVLGLLPPRTTPVDGEAVEAVAAEPVATEPMAAEPVAAKAVAAESS
jgi:hypothetical protein